MVANNKSNGAIAASLGLKKSTVAYVAANARRVDGGGRTDNRGRPKLLRPRELRGLRRLVEENSFASLAENAEKLNVGRTNPPAVPALCAVSLSTVRRAIKGLGMRSCTPAKKPFVSAVNQQKRLQWAKSHLGWSIQWASVLYSDESSFLVRQPQSRRVLRQPGQRYATSNLRPTFNSGSERVIVWGAFSGVGRTPLLRVEGSMNGASYVDVLESVVVHYMCADYGSPDGAWFQEDLAPCHTSKVAKECKQALGLKVLPWVGQSPDMNPIENTWSELDRRLRARPTAPKTKDQLFEVLQEEWEAIPDAYFKKLAESMPSRVRAVVAAKGAGTKYC